MTILVSDTSVIIDLERGRLLAPCFQLPFVFAVPDLLYKKELEGYGGSQLIAHGLRVESLSGEELQGVQRARAARPKLSLPDAYAYSLASSRQWGLLSGDGELRALAQAENIPLYGVLWITDQMIAEKIVEAAVVIAGLESIAADRRCRLPPLEIEVRLKRYRQE